MGNKWLGVALSLAVGLFGRAASAHEGGDLERHPCRVQAEKLCPGMRPGDGKFGPCMKEHKSELSQECREMILRGMGRRRRHGVCAPDAERFCPDTRPGDGKFGPCLLEHKDELLPECRAMIVRMTSKMQQAFGDSGVCAADAKRLCPDMRPGDGKFGPCMKEHRDELSVACQEFMAGMMKGHRRARRPEENDGGPREGK